MKKIFALLIALTMVLSIAACGGNEETSSGNNENPISSQQEQPSDASGSGQDEAPEDVYKRQAPSG